MASCALLAIAAPARRAAADEETSRDVELRYARHTGAQHCPDESALRSLVKEHLGYDPFVTRGKRVIVVTLSRTRARGGRGLRAQIDSLDARGAVAGARSLDSPSADCQELVSSVALAVSIAIDPLHASAPPPPSPPVPAAEPPPIAPPEDPLPPLPQPQAPPVPLADTPEPTPRSLFTPMVSAAFVSAIGSAPAVSSGGAAELRLRAGSTSLGLGARADAAASAAAQFSSGGSEGARVESSLLVATVAPCWHRGVVALCAVADLGALAGTATHVQISERQSTFFASAGGRVALAFPVGPWLLVGAYAEALATLTPTTLRIDHQDAWSTSAVAGDLGLQVSVQFP